MLRLVPLVITIPWGVFAFRTDDAVGFILAGAATLAALASATLTR